MIVGLCGGSGSGKTSLAHALVKTLQSQVTLLSQDRYYRDLSDKTLEQRRRVNFDHPDAIESTLLRAQLKEIQQGHSISAPVYDFRQHTRTGHKTLSPTRLVLVEGALIFALADVQTNFDYKIFIDCAADVRLLRRLRRDIAERGRTFEFSAHQWEATVKPMHEQFIEPYKANADLKVNGEDEISTNAAQIAGALNQRFGIS